VLNPQKSLLPVYPVFPQELQRLLHSQNSKSRQTLVSINKFSAAVNQINRNFRVGYEMTRTAVTIGILEKQSIELYGDLFSLYP
jgi:hypothetical protein